MKFALLCRHDHEFEGWFRSNADYEQQAKRGLLTCPVCGTSKVGKSLMAPTVTTGRKKETMAVAASTTAQREIMTQMMELARKVKQNAENVGDKFPEEARKIHYGETQARGIYGKASSDEVSELVEEGISIMPLPDVPDSEELN